MGGMPELVRYFVPVDDDKRFADKGRRYLSEIRTKWRRVEKGYLPSVIESRRENDYSEGKLVSVDESTYRYSWDSSFLVNGVLSDLVFNRGESHLTRQELVDSFTDEN